MAQKRRIQVCISEDLYASISTIARLSDVSMSGFISAILEAEKETVSQLVTLLVKSRGVAEKLTIRDKLQIDRQAMVLNHARAELGTILDTLTDTVVDRQEGAEGPGVRALGRVRAGLPHPLPINKGVKQGGTKGVDKDYRPKMPDGWKNV